MAGLAMEQGGTGRRAGGQAGGGGGGGPVAMWGMSGSRNGRRSFINRVLYNREFSLRAGRPGSGIDDTGWRELLLGRPGRCRDKYPGPYRVVSVSFRGS